MDKELQDQIVHRTEQLVTGTVLPKKQKTGLRRAAESIISGDVRSLMDQVLNEALVPTIKRAIREIGKNALDIIFDGEIQPMNNLRDMNRRAGRISYDKFYSELKEESAPDGYRRASRNYEFDTILFDSKGDAELVLRRMKEMLSAYSAVSVFDLFDTAGVTCDHTACRYGWENLDQAKTVMLRDGSGYILKLPQVRPLNK